MNVLKQVKTWLYGSDSVTPFPLLIDMHGNALRVGAPAFPQRSILCPDCGSSDAGEELDREKTTATLTCPDCGLSRRTELLSSDDLRAVPRKK